MAAGELDGAVVFGARESRAVVKLWIDFPGDGPNLEKNAVVEGEVSRAESFITIYGQCS